VEFTEEVGNDFVEEFAWSTPGHVAEIGGRKYELITVEKNVEERRWADIALIVLRDVEEDKIVGLPYDVPSTENQEGQGWFPYSYPPKLVDVKQETVVHWTFA
jgi:hypothetical protein